MFAVPAIRHDDPTGWPCGLVVPKRVPPSMAASQGEGPWEGAVGCGFRFGRWELVGGMTRDVAALNTLVFLHFWQGSKFRKNAN